MALLILIGALVLFGIGQKDRVTATADPSLRGVTLEELTANDPALQGHVCVSGFAFGRRYAYEKSEDGSWGRVWIPLFTQDVGKGRHCRVVVVSNNLKSKEDVELFLQRTTVTGALSGNISRDDKAMLTPSYPEEDFKEALVLHENVKPVTPDEANRLIISGILLGGVGALGLSFLIFTEWRYRVAFWRQAEKVPAPVNARAHSLPLDKPDAGSFAPKEVR